MNYLRNNEVHMRTPELTTLISEVGGGTNIQSKEAHVSQCKL